MSASDTIAAAVPAHRAYTIRFSNMLIPIIIPANTDSNITISMAAASTHVSDPVRSDSSEFEHTLMCIPWFIKQRQMIKVTVGCQAFF